MARETKIGLLAGLTFIICFAIILSNRGGRDAVTAEVSTLFSDKTSDGEPLGLRTALIRSAHSAYGRITNSRTDDAAAGPSSEPPQDQPPHQRENLREIQVVHGGSANPATSENELSHGTALAAPLAASETPTERLERRLAQLDRSSHSRPPVTDQAAMAAARSPGQSAPADSDRIGQLVGAAHHKVIAGETLSKIAAKHYGSRSQHVIDAIFDANRSTLSSPDEIKVGMALVLPAIQGAAPTEIAAREIKARTQGEPAREHPDKSDRPFRWYQIKKNDRYVTIANEQLGDRSRWKEIYQLNRHIFPDAGQIREGVLIKLPATPKHANSRGGR